MDATNTFDNSFEKSGYEMFNLVHLTDFENLLKLCQEKSFLDTVGKRPKLKKSFEKRNSQSPILGKEEHRASQQLLIECWACLDFVKRNNNITEEYDVLVPKRYCKTTDDTS